jgi:helix-turn-helix resolvase-like protein
MTGPGRPTLYKPEHADRARELYARGATNPDLAGRFSVARSTTAHVPLETRACMFWLRNRRPEDWRARAEAAPEIANDDLAAVLDAAGESMHHVGD